MVSIGVRSNLLEGPAGGLIELVVCWLELDLYEVPWTGKREYCFGIGHRLKSLIWYQCILGISGTSD